MIRCAARSLLRPARAWFPLLLLIAPAGCERVRGPDGAESGPVVDIAGCSEPCPEIVVERVAVLGDREDAVLPRVVTTLAAGYEYVAAGLLAPEGVVAVYDTAEGHLVRVLGRLGDGPYEFQLGVPYPGPDGMVWVVDVDNQRITELDRRGWITRELPFTGAIYDLLPLDSGRVLAEGILGGEYDPTSPAAASPPASAGLRYHVMARDGAIERSFGEPWSTVPADRGRTRRALDGHLLVSGGQVYSIREITATGEPVRTYVREADWFPAGDPTQPSPQSPGFADFRVDTEGRVWALSLVPTGSFRDAFDNEGRVSVASLDRVRDSVLEVIDLAERRVVARRRFPQARMGFVAGSDRLFSARQDSAGYVYFDLWRASVPETDR